MNLGPTIDVATGLIFVYLLLGLIVSAVQELIASAAQWRGKMLLDAVTQLIANGDINAEFRQQLLEHGLMRGLTADRTASYLSSKTFALAVIDTLSAGSSAPVFSALQDGIGKLPIGAARSSLITFVRDAAGDLDKFKLSVATWYDDAMDRVSGVYKRKSQLFATVFGVGVAIALNIDSIRIGTTLWTDDALRSNVAAAATAYAATCPNAAFNTTDSHGDSAVVGPGMALASHDPAADLTKARKSIGGTIAKLTDLTLPIGWEVFDGDLERASPTGKPPAGTGLVERVGRYWHSFGLRGLLLIVVGWLITGAATSMGAPFWFDLLKNILSLRGAGPKPLRADAGDAS